MVRFNELRIDDNFEKLIIDISIPKLPYYTNVYLKSIKIDTQDTYIDSFPSLNPVYVKEIDRDSVGNESYVKDYRIEIDKSQILPSLNSNLFFIYIETKGTPSVNTPCGLDNSITVGVTFNNCSIYNKLLNYLKELDQNCELPQNFINEYLQYKAVCIALDSGHFVEGIKYYKKFIQNSNKKVSKVTNYKCQ